MEQDVQVTLHQGAIEQIFFDSLAAMGISVDRPMTPVSIQLSDKQEELDDPESHPVRVRTPGFEPPLSASELTNHESPGCT